ncbi:MAG: NPCBM/NEW2 domain-containing protein, partial [Planctomycetota bacterium]|nr:NPCBM/NEW2 domain-containing protein [Planctomycetota bacterium]
MQIADRKFARGVGTHAISVISYVLDEKYEYLEAWVGVDASRAKGQGSVRFIVSNSKKAAKGHGADAELWGLVARDFPAPAARRQIAWEKEDRIWDNDWTELAEVGQRYAKATRGTLAPQA